MADLRFVRPQCDNKVRNMTPPQHTRPTLHVRAPSHTADRSTPWELFLTSEPRDQVKADHAVSLSSSQFTVSDRCPASPKESNRRNATGGNDRCFGPPFPGPKTSIHTTLTTPITSQTDVGLHVHAHGPAWSPDPGPGGGTPAQRGVASPGGGNTAQRGVASPGGGTPAQRGVASPGGGNTPQRGVDSPGGGNTPQRGVASPGGENTAQRGVASPGGGNTPQRGKASPWQGPFHLYTPGTPHPPHSLPVHADNLTTDVRKLPAMSTSCTCADDSLVDVRDEELEQLPEVNSPAGVFSSPAKYRGLTAMTSRNEPASTQPSFSHQPEMPTRAASFHSSPRGAHRFKRSVSSLDFQETQYTSFFASLRGKAVQVEEEEEDDGDGPDSHFSTLWDLRRAWIFESPFHRAQSADALMQSGKKPRQTSTAQPCTNTSVDGLRNGGGGEDSDQEEDTDADNATENSDRLRMRRGALAQPERMIMSQAVREKVERDVEKRKASMVRRVSQFFNVQLGLNREEDLI